MKENKIVLQTPSNAVRVFAGFAAQRLSLNLEDSEEEIDRKRGEFFSELGGTFMPGTPLMQARLGLSAYLPAVIDPGAGSHLPDEVAIIVYVSQEIYNKFRGTSLSRRMYTRSHHAAFNMGASSALFPGTTDVPTHRVGNGITSWAWYLFDKDFDWQAGQTRVVMSIPVERNENLISETDLITFHKSNANMLQSKGCDQLVTLYHPDYIVNWMYTSDGIDADFDTSVLTPANYKIFRDLPCETKHVVSDEDEGIEISGTSAFNFRFSRYLKFFNQNNTDDG